VYRFGKKIWYWQQWFVKGIPVYRISECFERRGLAIFIFSLLSSSSFTTKLQHNNCIEIELQSAIKVENRRNLKHPWIKKLWNSVEYCKIDWSFILFLFFTFFSVTLIWVFLTAFCLIFIKKIANKLVDNNCLEQSLSIIWTSI
jgi:hypothetical protein